MSSAALHSAVHHHHHPQSSPHVQHVHQHSSPNVSPASARKPRVSPGPAMNTPTRQQVSLPASPQNTPVSRLASSPQDSNYTTVTNPHTPTSPYSTAQFQASMDRSARSPSIGVQDTPSMHVDSPESASRSRRGDREEEEDRPPVPSGVDAAMAALTMNEAPEARMAQKSRQEHLKHQSRKETKFGEYILGQTLGEGEFGKVKMGWKKEGGVQVAIKLIRRESLDHNPTRLPKIYREISILRELRHPNIVRLHEMVETDRHIGLILEYASGGELFDHILNHRYLKDNAARRLFAQLVSGVGYLHKKGIVHRDLKLENLLLDRNRNIIITDFGFANTFTPGDELGEDIEYNLTNKDFVRKLGLEHLQPNGHRRGDLMQTSCGSPCYAAPELVVSDSLYTGRKVDVWSCGVILYAMLAGYLPFDDDPANPEGDNINLLYKYIVSTPLTFPEYVTPHARDLLRRILVPNPRKRADLFEVARHSWLSEYAHVVAFITSDSLPAVNDMTAPAPVGTQLGRSASVRETSKTHAVTTPGGLISKHAPITDSNDRPKTPRDAKRRTVQLEYVAPQSQTVRGEIAESHPPRGAHPLGENAAPAVQSPAMPSPGTPTRPTREPPRSVSDSNALNLGSPNARPSTSGTIDRANRLPSRGNSYARPVAATVATQFAEGRFSQPSNQASNGRPLSQQFPADFQLPADRPNRAQHRRSNTMESITKMFRSNSTRRQSHKPEPDQEAMPVKPEKPEKPEKASRYYPPVSLKNVAVPVEPEAAPRPSTSSRRSSFGLTRRNSGGPNKRSSRRFSFLPSSFSRLSFVGPSREDTHSSEGRRDSMSGAPPSSRQQRASGMAFGQGTSPTPSDGTSGSISIGYDSQADARRRMPPSSQQPVRGVTAPDLSKMLVQEPSQQRSNPAYQYDQYKVPTTAELRQHDMPSPKAAPSEDKPSRPYPPGFNKGDVVQKPVTPAAAPPAAQKPAVLQKTRKFGEAYEDRGVGGSSGGARRVMDWFRKRGKERSG